MSSRRCNVPIVHVIVALDMPQILGIVVSLYIDFHWPKWPKRASVFALRT